MLPPHGFALVAQALVAHFRDAVTGLPFPVQVTPTRAPGESASLRVEFTQAQPSERARHAAPSGTAPQVWELRFRLHAASDLPFAREALAGVALDALLAAPLWHRASLVDLFQRQGLTVSPTLLDQVVTLQWVLLPPAAKACDDPAFAECVATLVLKS